MIQVLLADDSQTSRQQLAKILQSEDISIIGHAVNGQEAVRMAKELEPDLLLMDVYMPGMDGLEATSKIMYESPLPIILISGRRTGELVIEALNRGALAVLEKPREEESGHLAVISAHLLTTIRVISSMKNEKRFRASRTPVTGKLPQTIAQQAAEIAQTMQPRIKPEHQAKPEIVAIASSVGGPAALETIFCSLPADFPLPILVTQHISKGFVGHLAAWLDRVAPLRVKLAEEGEHLAGRTVYLAPDECHLGVRKNGTVALDKAPAIKGFQPSGTFMFHSVAQHYGPAAIAVILTGMGDDGVAGLHEIKRRKGLIIAQDMATSIVFGMPGFAVAQQLPDYLLPIDIIAKQLVDCLC